MRVPQAACQLSEACRQAAPADWRSELLWYDTNHHRASGQCKEGGERFCRRLFQV